MKKTLDDLDKLANAARPFQARKERAKERAKARTEKTWCFALLGLNCDFESYEFKGTAILRNVEEPPGIIELAGACEDAGKCHAVARYSSGIEYELALFVDEFNDDRFLFTFAWWIIALLRIKTGVEILVPVAANYSWSVIAGVPERTCRCEFIEDIPRAVRFGSKQKVVRDDLVWVEEHLERFANLLEFPAFATAVESVTTFSHHANLRMSAAAIWAGIESIFMIESELRFRLATYIAALLAERGASRLELYKKIKKLYDVRSKAVHGGKLSEKDLKAHVVEAKDLLLNCLRKLVDKGSMLSTEELDSLLFEK